MNNRHPQCRHELLDRTLIWNQRHLLQALREFEHFYNEHWLHQGLLQKRPLREPGHAADLTARIEHRQALGGLISEYRRAGLASVKRQFSGYG